MNTLSGIRVLDLTHAIAAPSATNLLASLGAEVIKVERFEGDTVRYLSPWAFETFNRNKKSIALNLKTEDGREVVRKLAARSDLFVQSFRPGVTDGFGLDSATLTALNPRMIVVTFSAFGTQGPNATRRGVEAIIQAESGLARLQGSVLGSTMFVDETTGLVLGNAMLAGLLHRERTGEVRHVETSLFATALYLQAPALLETSITGISMNQELHWQRYPLARMFETQDSAIYIAVYWDRDWQQFCDVLGRPDLPADSRFSTAEARSENRAALASELAAEIRKYPQAELLTALHAHGIMAGPARDHREVLECDQVTATHSARQLTTSTGQPGTFVRRPFTMAGDDGLASSQPAPLVGAHTLEVLASLGIGPADAERLRANGAVEWARPGSDRPDVPGAEATAEGRLAGATAANSSAVVPADRGGDER